MGTDEIALCAEALVMLGANPISSLVGDEAEQVVARSLFDTTLGYCVSSHPWRWATRSVDLARNDAVPEGPYEASYDLPVGTQRIISVRVGEYSLEFDRYERTIQCDATADEQVTADLVIVPAVTFWPGYFRAYMVAQLASAFAVPITDDVEKGRMYMSAASRAFTAAKTADSQGRTQRRLPLGGLARIVGSARGW